MTIEELKDLRYANTPHFSGRPSPNMTDKQWQEKFKIMRATIKPSRYKKMVGKGINEPVHWDESYGNYDGMTNWQEYAQFINDTLRFLREGYTEYAWFTYQITDLFRFEHDRLRTKYDQSNQVWELWLDDKAYE